VTGRYSTKLLPRIRERLEEFLRDPKLKHLDREIALNLVLAEECLGDEAMEAAFKSLAEPIDGLRSALAAKKVELEPVLAAARSLLEAHERGASAWARIEAFFAHIDRHERLVKTDAFQQRTAKEGLSAHEQAAFLLMVQDALERALRKHEVANPAAVLSEVARNLDGAFGARPGGASARPDGH